MGSPVALLEAGLADPREQVLKAAQSERLAEGVRGRVSSEKLDRGLVPLSFPKPLVGEPAHETENVTAARCFAEAPAEDLTARVGQELEPGVAPEQLLRRHVAKPGDARRPGQELAAQQIERRFGDRTGP
jgi:hypothetical protein